MAVVGHAVIVLLQLPPGVFPTFDIGVGASEHLWFLVLSYDLVLPTQRRQFDGRLVPGASRAHVGYLQCPSSGSTTYSSVLGARYWRLAARSA